MTKLDLPILFFAPFVAATQRIEDEWLDGNGHLNMAHYHILFDRAVDELWLHVGMGPDYAQSRGHATLLAENHILYQREVKSTDAMRVTIQMVDYDHKRMHLYQEMRHAKDGWTAAGCEGLFVHVNLTDRRSAHFPHDILANLATLKSAHSRLSKPQETSRAIGLSTKRQRPPMRREDLN